MKNKVIEFLTTLFITLFLFLVVGLCIVSFERAFEIGSKSSETDLQNSLKDSITYYRDAYNNLYAKTSIIETDNEKYFLQIKSKDSTIIRLQNLVSKYKKNLNAGGSVTVIKDSIYIDRYKPVILGKDTIVFSQSVLLDTVSNKWIKAKYGFDKGVSVLNLSVLNDYEIVIGKDSKTRQNFVQVKNNNPYTTVNTLKTFRKELPKDKKLGLGFYVGYGLNTNMQLKPSIGISLNYNLIEF